MANLPIVELVEVQEDNKTVKKVKRTFKTDDQIEYVTKERLEQVIVNLQAQITEVERNLAVFPKD